MRAHKIAVIPGDGIGLEIIAAGLEVLEACAARDSGFELDVTQFDWGSDYYKRHHLGEKDAAVRLIRAVERVTADPALHTPDLGGSSPRPARSPTPSAGHHAATISEQAGGQSESVDTNLSERTWPR